MCTSAGFLSNIAKYVCKPEPHGSHANDGAQDERDPQSNRARFLNARVVGAPEAAFRLFGYRMHSATGVTALCTKPPEWRLRAVRLAVVDCEEGLSYVDGTLEKYANRPRGRVSYAARAPRAGRRSDGARASAGAEHDEWVEAEDKSWDEGDEFADAGKSDDDGDIRALGEVAAARRRRRSRRRPR
jgi:hypothetical protein